MQLARFSVCFLLLQVLYVDFGNKEWVTQERVRQIEMEFLYLPFQAVECRLPLCANNASGKLWSDGAKYEIYLYTNYTCIYIKCIFIILNATLLVGETRIYTKPPLLSIIPPKWTHILISLCPRFDFCCQQNFSLCST